MADDLIMGTLHVYVAFDWGDEIHFDRAQKLIPPASFQELLRRRRTPTSFSFRPPPLHLALGHLGVTLPEVGRVEASAGLTVFDFGAVSLCLRVALDLPADGYARLAGGLADPSPLVEQARTILAPIYKTLLPAIDDAAWDGDFSEEYFVFQFAPGGIPTSGDEAWLAGLVHLEASPLSTNEIAEALRLEMRYGPTDRFVADWSAAALFDTDCDETLQAIEFANLQLLEFRHIDHRLDQSLADAARVIHPLTRSYLPFWRVYARPMRQLGELKVEANSLFERTGNVLKLIGDSYLARVYRLVDTRFHLEAWEKSIQRKLEVAEGVYQVVSDQAGAFRGEFLELVVVLLIFIEIVLAVVRH
jgi:hypothetical protein